MATNDIGPRIGIDGEKEFNASIKAINAQMKSLGAEMKAVTAEFASNAKSEEALSAKNEVLGRSVEAAKNKLTVLDSQLERQKGKLSELAAELDRTTAEFGENSVEAQRAQNAYNQQYRSVADLEAQYQRTRQQLAEYQNQLEDTGEQQDQLNPEQITAMAAGWSMLKPAVDGVLNSLREAIDVGMAFDSAMADIAATMGTAVDSLGELRDFAQDMGATTTFSATQAAEALNYMALAGYDADQAMEALPNVLNLAAAGGMELATASDMITDAQTALGLSMEESARMVDQMAKTSTKTNTSVSQLGEAILTVGGTAKFMKGGTQEINQALGVLADNSIKGAEGGTKLRNIILSLSTPTEKAAKKLDELGASIFDASGNMRSFSEIFPEMQQALSRLTDQQQIEALGEIFNSRDIAAAQALLGTTVERWDELAVAIDGAAGSAEKMAQTRLDNLAGDITLLESAADGARIALSDSLTPALRDVTQAGTAVLTFVGGAVKEIPLLGQAMAGVAAAGVTLGAGMVVMTAGITSAEMAFAKLTAALVSNPFGQIALAVGIGVTALTAFASAAEHANDKITETARAVEESRAAWESQKDAVSTQMDSVESLVRQLDDLASRENRTAGEKERLLAVTNALNEAVPGLGLSYDTLNDTLSMTTEQILELARAQAEMEERQAAAAAVVEAEQLHAQAVRELEQAEKDLAAATSARNDAQAAGLAGDMGMIEAMAEINSAVKDAQKRVDELTQAEKDSALQVEEMTKALEELASESADTADAMDGMSDSIENSGDTAQDTSMDLAELEEATLYAAGAADTLSDALKEQQKEGSLSLKTTNELIEAGYASAIAIDSETGAVTLNREEYARLADAKIQEQLTALETQKTSIQTAQKLLAEKLAAQDAANGYYDLAEAKTIAAYADDLQALDLQVAALKRARDALTSYGTTVTTTAKKSSSASKKIKTQAEKDLEEYKTLKATLDHEQAMGMVQEGEYYRRLGELRDQYLSDSANLSEYRKASETIYKAEQKAAESAIQEEQRVLQEREKLWQTAGQNILKLEEEFQKELSSRAQEIVNSYKLFDAVPEYQKSSGEELITNLENQINAIQSFYDNIAALEERGVGISLVDDIRKMGVQASGELAGLLELTDEQLSQYSDLYQEKQALANRIALEELQGLRDETNREILSQMDDVAELYDTNAPALGLTFTQKLADGMFEGMGDVERAAMAVANAASAAFEQAYNQDVEAMMTASGRRSVTRDDIGELLAGAVNGITAATSGGGTAQPMNVTLVTEDKLTIARAFVPDIRTAEREDPDVMDDM